MLYNKVSYIMDYRQRVSEKVRWLQGSIVCIATQPPQPPWARTSLEHC